jgi:hypothetical protein
LLSPDIEKNRGGTERCDGEDGFGVADIIGYAATADSPAKSTVVLDSFINRQTLALEIRCLLATFVSDMPDWRSATTCSRLIFSGALPILRPSNFARLIPACTRSTISDRSSSAVAPIIVNMARPSGLTSICAKDHGFHKPSKANEAAFDGAVDEIAKVSARLLRPLETTATPKSREEEAAKARASAAERFGT